MIRQYPYSLLVSETSPSTQTHEGDFTVEATNEQIISKCRDEVNSKGQSVQLADSTELVFESLIQLPKSCPHVTLGTLVTVMQGATIRVQGTCKRFQRDQLHCRLWI